MSNPQEEAQASVVELVRRIVVALVDDPLKVEFTPVLGERSTVVEIAALPPEVGQIIGRAGRNIHALQAVAQAVGAKHGLDVQVFVLDRLRGTSGT